MVQRIESASVNAGDTGSIPASGKIPHATGNEAHGPRLLSLHAAAAEACAPRTRAPQQEKPVPRNDGQHLPAPIRKAQAQ